MAALHPAGAVDAATIGLLSNAEDAVLRFYGGLDAGELALLRVTLARYFQDKRVRWGAGRGARHALPGCGGRGLLRDVLAVPPG
jgi:hypothetical protein